jgi:hypothetical protein
MPAACAHGSNLLMMLRLALLILCVPSGLQIVWGDNIVSRCELEYEGLHQDFGCWRAVFSPQAVALTGTLIYEPSGLCPVIESEDKVKRPLCAGSCLEAPRIAVVMRGGCSFSVKALQASAMGYQALLIVSQENSLFTIGSSNASFVSPIPVLAVEKGLLGALTPLASAPVSFSEVFERITGEGKVLLVSLRHGQRSSSISVHNADEITALCLQWLELLQYALLALLALFLAAAFFSLLYEVDLNPPQSLGSKPGVASSSLLHAIAFGALALLFITLRLGTLRRLDGPVGEDVYGLLQGYNHRETDEQIYEALIRAMAQSPSSGLSSAYQLRTLPILRRLQLPLEQYAHALFIHPPLFVLLSVLLLRWLPGLPLPLHSSLLQLSAWLLCTPWLCTEALRDTSLRAHSLSISLLTMALLLVCPVAAFCAQKLWLDNALLLTATLCAALHMRCVRADRAWLCACSGLCYGGLALNTKLTALGLLPFLLAWILSHPPHPHPPPQPPQRRRRRRHAAAAAAWRCLCFLLGATLGHAPWLLLYQRATGRWLPSAWPSPQLQQRFPFLQQAVQRPWHHYFTLLCTLHPAYLLGLVLVLACAGQAYRRVRRQQQQLQMDDALRLLVLALYPLSFLLALTLLGMLGAGYQARFLLPALPGLALLGAVAIHLLLRRWGDNAGLQVLLLLLGAYAAMHALYYGLLAPTLHADVEQSVFSMLRVVLQSHFPRLVGGGGGGREEQARLEQVLRHFGLAAQPSR